MVDVGIMDKHRLVKDLLGVKRELVAKHTDLLEQLNQTVKNIKAVNRVIAQYDIDAANVLVFPTIKYKAYFAPGELLALIAQALKAMPEGATLREISDRIQAKQMQAERELPKQLVYSVKEALERMLSRNAVVKSRRQNNRVIWLLAKRGGGQVNQAAEAKVAPSPPAGNVTPLPLRR